MVKTQIPRPVPKNSDSTNQAELVNHGTLSREAIERPRGKKHFGDGEDAGAWATKDAHDYSSRNKDVVSACWIPGPAAPTGAEKGAVPALARLSPASPAPAFSGSRPPERSPAPQVAQAPPPKAHRPPRAPPERAQPARRGLPHPRASQTLQQRVLIVLAAAEDQLLQASLHGRLVLLQRKAVPLPEPSLLRRRRRDCHRSGRCARPSRRFPLGWRSSLSGRPAWPRSDSPVRPRSGSPVRSPSAPPFRRHRRVWEETQALTWNLTAPAPRLLAVRRGWGPGGPEGACAACCHVTSPRSLRNAPSPHGPLPVWEFLREDQSSGWRGKRRDRSGKFFPTQLRSCSWVKGAQESQSIN